MAIRPTQHHATESISRRRLLQTGLAAGATLAAWPLYYPAASWGAEAGTPKRGGILRARGWDPPHFDPHLTRNFKSNTALSFVYSKLLRHKVGPDVPPGTFIVEPDLAERWEAPDDTTYIFHLRQGVKWHNKPPVNGRERAVTRGPPWPGRGVAAHPPAWGGGEGLSVRSEGGAAVASGSRASQGLENDA